MKNCIGFPTKKRENTTAKKHATSTHAWVECWIEGMGWCSLDATLNSSYIFLHFACIRMRYGLDFEDCDIGLLSDDIEPLEITKL